MPGFVLVNLTASLRNKYGTDASNPASCQTDCSYTSPSGALNPSADILIRYMNSAYGTEVTFKHAHVHFVMYHRSFFIGLVQMWQHDQVREEVHLAAVLKPLTLM